MKLSLYPVSTQDRALFWLGVANGFLAVVNGFFAVVIASVGLFVLAVFHVLVSILMFVPAYLFPDKQTPEGDEYTLMLERIAQVTGDLSTLSAFLEREKKRVVDTQNTLTTLQQKRRKLQPILKTQEETVHAILAAYSANLRSTAWKDRLIGFSLGLIASLIASWLFGLLNR